MGERLGWPFLFRRGEELLLLGYLAKPLSYRGRRTRDALAVDEVASRALE